MKTFEIGKKYLVRSVCDHNCVWTFEVIDRTAATVKLSDGKQVKTCRINKAYSEYINAETVFPLGKYSMCPVLSADKAI